MNWTIPGTVLQAPRQEAAHIPEQFRSMFLAGGIVLSQVSAITGLENYTVQNWVKRGFLTPPQNKRYTLRQLCRIRKQTNGHLRLSVYSFLPRTLRIMLPMIISAMLSAVRQVPKMLKKS